MSALSGVDTEQWMLWLDSIALIDLQAFLFTLEHEPFNQKFTLLPYLMEEYPNLTELWSKMTALHIKLLDF